jgi:hypothetical protein
MAELYRQKVTVLAYALEHLDTRTEPAETSPWAHARRQLAVVPVAA